MVNEMYYYCWVMIVVNNDLCWGDLLFFYIYSCEIVDYMGVYLGDGQFIELLCIGEIIWVSWLVEFFWQDYFLGVWWILMEEMILQDG